MTLQNLLSKIQRSIGDETFTKIKRAEMMDIVDNAVQSVASTVKLWVEQIEITPRRLTETFTVTTFNDLAALTPTLYDTAFVLDTGLRYRFYKSQWEIYPYNTVKIDPELTQIYQTIQVWKNGVQCTEQSLQSVNQGYATGYFFTGTNAVTPNALGIQYAHYRRPDDGSDLVFARDFESSDTVVIIYRNERPIVANLWTNNITIPYVVGNAIQFEAIERCWSVLFMRGEDAALQRAQYASELSRKELAGVDAYLRNLLNENSSINVQPLRWLPE